jgi:NADP-dependent 3-hydroxy acid dehydrogenase YdfG
VSEQAQAAGDGSEPRIAAVTGASAGVGRAIAVGLGALG